MFSSQSGEDAWPNDTKDDDVIQNSTTCTTTMYQCICSLLEKATLNTAEEMNQIMDMAEEMLQQARNSSNNQLMSRMTRVLSHLMTLPDEVLEEGQAQYQVAVR